VDKEEFKKRILEEPDFIKCLKCSNSLTRYLTRNPKEADDSTIARLLMISEEEVDVLYKEAIDFLKLGMVDSVNED
jgi:hypothetical protein